MHRSKEGDKEGYRERVRERWNEMESVRERSTQFGGEASSTDHSIGEWLCHVLYNEFNKN